MFCKKCGAALPSNGFICHSCGAMMDKEQIEKQKKIKNEKENAKFEVNLLSDKYSKGHILREYQTQKDNKYLGVVLIVLIVIILVILAILKVM